MKETINILPGSIVYSMITEKEREWDGFLSESILVLQISGKMTVETSSEKFSTQSGDMVLTRKYQLAKISKMPFEGENYQTISIQLNDNILRSYTLKNGIEIKQKYNSKLNIFIPQNKFLQGYFNSLMPYGDKSQTGITDNLGSLKVEEAIELLLRSLPQLKEFLFDFSEPHKIDLEEFMNRNFHFNVPVEKFARLSVRSLAGFKRDFQKTFYAPPRQWLKDKRLTVAHYQIENNGKKPSEIYLDLGFESLSHFSFAFKKLFGYTPTELTFNKVIKKK